MENHIPIKKAHERVIQFYLLTSGFKGTDKEIENTVKKLSTDYSFLTSFESIIVELIEETLEND